LGAILFLTGIFVMPLPYELSEFIVFFGVLLVV
jgi:hypothetical protein